MNPHDLEAAQAATARQEADLAQYGQALADLAAATGLRRLLLAAKAALLSVHVGDSLVTAQVAEYDATHPGTTPAIGFPEQRTNGDV